MSPWRGAQLSTGHIFMSWRLVKHMTRLHDAVLSFSRHSAY